MAKNDKTKQLEIADNPVDKTQSIKTPKIGAFIKTLSKVPYRTHIELPPENEFKYHKFVIEFDIASILNRKIKEINAIKITNPNATHLLCEYDGNTHKYFITDENKNKTNAPNEIYNPDLIQFVENASFDQLGRRINTLSYEAAFDMWYNCLCNIAEGNGKQLMMNPAIVFKKMVEDGQYDDANESQFYSEMIDNRNLSCICENQTSIASTDVLNNALSKINIHESAIIEISNILANETDDTIFNINTTINNNNTLMAKFENMSPQDIYNKIAENVIHQEAAKKAAAILVYNHIRHNCRNIVMAGPTGCGKTEIWSTLQKIFPFIKIINGPQISGDGWKGSYKLADVFLEELNQPEMASNLIIVIDEADKMFEPAIGSGGTDYSRMIQSELLKIMDHDNDNFITFNGEHGKTITINSKTISIVLCGSFERMLMNKSNKPSPIGFASKFNKSRTYDMNEFIEQDLIDFANVRTEVAGRITQIVTLKEMTTDDFKELLDHKTASPIKKLEHNLNVSININKEAKSKLANEAAESKLGCRAIRARLLRYIDNQMFETPNKHKYCLSKQIMDDDK